MNGRGRKSAAALTLVGGVQTIRRVEAPSDLSPTEAELFQSVVCTKPADWFDADTVPLLVEYVRAVVMCNTLAAQISKAIKKGDAMTARDFLKLRDMECKRVASLATKMRLSQQSKYGARGADGAARGTRSGGKPWEFEHDAS